jgi:starvation-inducible DNA-binding protein
MPTPTPPALATPHPMGDNAATQVAARLNAILADAYALYLKTKNFHWHVSGPHFRDYHLLLDEQALQVLAMTDLVAERVRKLGRRTHTSIGSLARAQSIPDNDAEFVAPGAMMAELIGDNNALAGALRDAKEICDEAQDYATSALIDTWLDEAERRVWFLFETARGEPEMIAASPAPVARRQVKPAKPAKDDKAAKPRKPKK